MKGESDLVAHVTAATGVAEAEVRRVIDAAFGFLRSSVLAGEAISHQALGAIRPRQREKDGVTKTVFRFLPHGEAEPGKGRPGGGGRKGGGARRGGRGAGGGGLRKGRGAGGG